MKERQRLARWLVEIDNDLQERKLRVARGVEVLRNPASMERQIIPAR